MSVGVLTPVERKGNYLEHSSFYLPISKYLTEADSNPKDIKEKDKFYFRISNDQFPSDHFYVYKSLACFLSCYAYQQLRKKIFFLCKSNINMIKFHQVK
jgi:hypothetical protein